MDASDQEGPPSVVFSIASLFFASWLWFSRVPRFRLADEGIEMGRQFVPWDAIRSAAFRRHGVPPHDLVLFVRRTPTYEPPRHNRVYLNPIHFNMSRIELCQEIARRMAPREFMLLNRTV